MIEDVRRYRVFVEPLGEALGGGFVAYAPQIRNCLTDGDTPEEALRNIYDAIGCRLAAGPHSCADAAGLARPRA